MNKDSNTASDEKVFYITKEQFQDKIKAKYHSHVELKRELEGVKNRSLFQLMTASAKKLWHTTRDVQSAQPDDVLKLFNRSSIRSSRAQDVPEGAIVLKKKTAHHLNFKNLAGLGIAAAAGAQVGDSVQNGLHEARLKDLIVDAAYHYDVDSFKTAGDIDIFFKKVESAITSGDLKGALDQTLLHLDPGSFVTNSEFSAFMDKLDIVLMPASSPAMTVTAAAVAAGLTAGALLVSKKPWSAASSFELGNCEVRSHANDIIQETAVLMDKEFLEHKKRLGEKIYYLDKDSVKSYSADHPAEAAKGFNPGVMLDGQNWKLYVKSATGKAPDGAIMLELQPKLKAVLGSHLDVKNMEKAVQLYNKATGSSIRTSDAFNFPSKASWYMCQKMIDQALGKDTMRESKHEVAVSVR